MISLFRESQISSLDLFDYLDTVFGKEKAAKIVNEERKLYKLPEIKV